MTRLGLGFPLPTGAGRKRRRMFPSLPENEDTNCLSLPEGPPGLHQDCGAVVATTQTDVVVTVPEDVAKGTNVVEEEDPNVE